MSSGTLAVVDCDLCAAVMMCSSYAPDAFALNEEGCSVFHPSNTPDVVLLAAAEACPMLAITVTASSGEQLFP